MDEAATDKLAERTKLCWWCNKKLYPKKGGGVHYRAVINKGFTQIVHKQCVEEMQKGGVL
jgi:hypothetical protein